MPRKPLVRSCAFTLLPVHLYMKKYKTLTDHNTEALSCVILLSSPTWGAVGNFGAVLVRNCKAFSHKKRQGPSRAVRH